MEKYINMWHRLKPIKLLGNGGEILFPVCAVLEVTGGSGDETNQRRVSLGNSQRTWGSLK